MSVTRAIQMARKHNMFTSSYGIQSGIDPELPISIVVDNNVIWAAGQHHQVRLVAPTTQDPLDWRDTLSWIRTFGGSRGRYLTAFLSPKPANEAAVMPVIRAIVSWANELPDKRDPMSTVAKRAIMAQDAVNLTALLHSWEEWQPVIRDDSHARGIVRNKHPVNVIMADKLKQLAGDDYAHAYSWCADQSRDD